MCHKLIRLLLYSLLRSYLSKCWGEGGFYSSTCTSSSLLSNRFLKKVPRSTPWDIRAARSSHPILPLHILPLSWTNSVWAEADPLSGVLSFSPLSCSLRGSPVAQLVKNLPAMRETWVRSLGWEGLLEKGKATHSSILAWRIGVAKKWTWLDDFHLKSWTQPSKPSLTSPALRSVPRALQQAHQFSSLLRALQAWSMREHQRVLTTSTLEGVPVFLFTDSPKHDNAKVYSRHLISEWVREAKRDPGTPCPQPSRVDEGILMSRPPTLHSIRTIPVHIAGPQGQTVSLTHLFQASTKALSKYVTQWVSGWTNINRHQAPNLNLQRGHLQPRVVPTCPERSEAKSSLEQSPVWHPRTGHLLLIKRTWRRRLSLSGHLVSGHPPQSAGLTENKEIHAPPIKGEQQQNLAPPHSLVAGVLLGTPVWTVPPGGAGTVRALPVGRGQTGRCQEWHPNQTRLWPDQTVSSAAGHLVPTYFPKQLGK